MKEKGRKVIAQNRRARHDYTILDTYEAGVALVGTEVEEPRGGPGLDGGRVRQHRRRRGVAARAAHPRVRARQLDNHAPRRSRKLLLHRGEIDRLYGKIREGGLTLVPLSLYFNDGKVKCEIALARGKKDYDKRHDMAKQDTDREMQRAIGRATKGRARSMR